MKHDSLGPLMSMILLEKTAPMAPPRKTIFECLEDPRATAVLPSLKSIISELETLADRGSSHLVEITRLVRMDQSVSLQVLRIANSAYYGPPAPIADIQSAILYIGLSTLRGAVASTRCMEKTCDLPQDILDWKEFWVHAAGVGYITMDLAARLPESIVTPESFYLMGLFHDVGKVVLACLMPDEFIDIYARAAAEEKPLAAMEIECLGVEHGHIGAWYMEKQGIPLVVREAVRFHHSDMLEDQPHFVHAALVRLADRLAHDIHLGNSGNQALMGDPYASVEWAWYRDYCGMAKGRADKLQTAVAKQVARTAGLVREVIT
jgi:HD-like signal output (HDOD) protein